jgi:hypothetical protein
LSRWKKGLLIAAGLFLAIVLVVWAYLPAILKWEINRALAGMPGYAGRVEYVGLSLFEGVARVEGVSISRKEPALRRVFSIDALRVVLRWREAFRGNFVGEIQMVKPWVSLKTEDLQAAKKETAKDVAEQEKKRVRRVFPMKIDRFRIEDGAFHYYDQSASPPIHLFATKVEVEAENLTNTRKLLKSLMSTLQAQAKVMDSGDFSARLAFNPFHEQPTFNLDGQLQGLRLTSLNEYLRRYVGMDVQGGVFGFVMEAAAEDGRFKGYVKPTIKDLNVVNLKKEKMRFSVKVKEVAAEALGEILENQPKDRVATKIEFSGRFKDPHVSLWSAAVNILRNAFIRALSPTLEGSIGFKDAPDKPKKRKP